MNGQTQMSGQVPGRAQNQANQQFSGLSQHKVNAFSSSSMHNYGAQIMDPELALARQNMQNKITQILQRRNSTMDLQRLPELAKRFEELIFKDAVSKEDYMSITSGSIEQRLHTIIKNTSNNNHPNSHHISSSSSISTMIPTPGMSYNGSTNSVIPSTDNSIMTTTAADMAANGPAGAVHNSLFNASDGSIHNNYQQSSANVCLGSGGNGMISPMGRSQQFSQMIPTPGLNNGLSVSDCSNGVEFSSISSMPPQQHQRYMGNHNSRILLTLGGQLGNGLRSNLHQRPSPYRFSNGISDGSVGPTRSNLQVVNGPVASEGYLNMVAYGSSPNLSRQRFDQQICQPTLPSEKHATNTSDLLGSENLYGPASSVASVITNQNTNPMSLHSKSISSHGLLTGTTNMQPMQQSPQLKSQMQDHSQRANLQSPKLTREHFMQPQHQIQNFQQQPILPHAQFAQHQQEHQQQQIMSKTNTMRQSSMNSSFGGQVKLEHGIESHNEFLTPQASELFQLLELQNQYEQNISTGNHSKVPHLVRSLPEAQEFQQSFSQSSHQMLHLQKQVAESQNVYNGLFSGSQYDAVQKGTWHPQPPQKSQMPNDKTFEQLQEEFQLTGQVESQQSPFDGSVTGHAAAKSISAPQPSSAVAFRPAKSMCDNNYFQQRRWLLFLIHAQKCSDPKGTCKEVNCIKGQQLLKHIERCSMNQCEYPRCHRSKQLLGHCRNCDVVDCPVCIPVRDFLASHRQACKPVPDTCLLNTVTDHSRTINTGGSDSMVTMPDGVLFEASQGPQTSKRMKVQHNPSIVPKKEYSPVVVSIHPLTQGHVTQDTQPQQADTAMCMKSEIVEMKTNSSIGFVQGNPPVFDNTMDEDVHTAMTDVEPVVPNGFVGDFKQETMLIEKENDQVKIEVKQEANVPASDLVPGSKTGKSKIKGVSLIELFTPEQIREHIVSLRQWIGQSKVKAEKNQAMERSMTENSCQLCAVEKLTFEPPPIYCTPCGARIKRNAAYYTKGNNDTRLFFCIPCYNEARGETIQVDGSTFPKVKLEKKKNDEETEEWWVQCDKCEAWQHQICALFNGRRNDGGRAEYTCPNCCVEEIENRERKPLPQSTVLGAKDLPKTILSDHIEERLFRRLKLERQERARHMGKTFDEVPGAEALVVRVVSSVDKKLEVKQRFLEIFQEENYPTDFPYKSKVILLFQKIDGVEVCLFSMYVQEFGSECQFPNQRRVYLSYLDSVKYFRPEIRAVTGEALRTFVYHEILIGYLEYCKRRGFTSCYIWACPPLKGEDYILYCHPEIQKTPKSDKLREWYLSMLRKASKENIVVDLTNLYDHFFTSLGECKAKVTAARLPYFDGDYWPGAAEDMINQLRQEEDGRAQQKKGKTKKAFTKRALKAAGQTDLTGNASKDALLMQKLGETISSMKEDFIMVHLQHACTHCCLLMVSGTRWVCNQCKNFQLCDKCYDAEQRLDDRGKHPINNREKHVFRPVQINDVSSDTKDRDEMLESEFFDTRQAFLSLCQGNHYQYDTLRRAKHSSMMVLYHLHNPSAPAFVTTCNVCLNDIETGQGWRCETCPEFDVCNACYQKEGCIDHPHKLINHPSIAERDAQNKEAREKRVRQLRNMLDLLLHASECRFAHCHYTNCRRVKALFRHGIRCPTRATGGCSLCKSMWNLLQLHARSCKVSNCCVPRCKDLKEHLRRLQQQSDSRRRAAVMEMMRQRAAEVAGSTE